MRTSDDLSSCLLQHDVCRSYVESQCTLGWVLIPERFDDEGYSGATLDRPALDRLLAHVNRGLVDQVIVHRLDRLSRSLRGCVKLLHEFRRLEVGLVVVTAPELGHSAQETFLLNILASFTEFERDMIAARIADTRARLQQRHLRFAGGMPFGYDADRRSKQLVPNELDGRRTRKPEAFVYGPMWPLKGRIKCGTCGRPLTPHSSRRGNKVYRYCRCRSTAGGQPPCGYQIAEGTIESAVADVLPRAHRDELDSHRIRAHVESVLYDNETLTVTVRLVPQDDKTIAVQLGPPDEFSNSGPG